MKRILFLILVLFLQENLSARLPDLIPYRKGNLWGYCDSMKRIMIPCKFREAWFFEGESAFVMLDDSTGYIMKNGDFHSYKPESMINPHRDWCIVPQLPYELPHFEIYENSKNGNKLPRPFVDDSTGRIGYCDCYKNILIPAQFISGNGFHEGLASVQVNDTLWGYINEKGKLVIALENVTKLGNFSNGDAIVTIGMVQGLINKKGKFIYAPIADEITLFGNFFIVGNNHNYDYGTYLLLDNLGNFADSRVFNLAKDEGNDLLEVMYQRRYNFLSKNGKEISPVWFKNATDFRNGLVAVENSEGLWGFIDEKGKEVIPFKYDRPNRIHNEEGTDGFDDNGLCSMGSQGYIDIHGTEYWED